MNHSQALTWVDKYVSAWRAPGTSQLAKIFSENISYRPSPWKEPIHGLAELGLFWEQGRTGHSEAFKIDSEVITVENSTAVVRVQVIYANDTPRQWRDLWIFELDNDGLCYTFEEWPFAKNQYDGHKATIAIT